MVKISRLGLSGIIFILFFLFLLQLLQLEMQFLFQEL
jgi:hypothetical protein